MLIRVVHDNHYFTLYVQKITCNNEMVFTFARTSPMVPMNEIGLNAGETLMVAIAV